MEHHKLKGRPPFPFETIGVAIAFSPRLEAVLGEAKILSDAFGARLLLIHVGEKTATKESRLEELMEKNGLEKNKINVIWHNGNPSVVILELCKKNAVDLLVVGAMRKENMLRYYLGSVARKISRQAKCSVLLMTEPKKEGTRYKKIMVNGIESLKTVHTINTAVYFGKHLDIKDLIVATEINQLGLAMTMASDSTALQASKMRKEFSEEEMNKVHDIVTKVSEREGIQISEKLIKGKPGFAIRQYAETKKADLLVINSPDQSYGIIDRIFTHDMEYILEDLPCNVLIVHSRVSENK
jgi:nucleotide-binding universal stress UspA family protein